MCDSNLLHLPDVALEKIFSFLTYDQIANNRLVCQRFNQVGSRLLTRGFLRLEKKHAVIYKQVKSVLPRRESERRAHPLARHCDILQSVETRISMLNMTYMKFIESGLLCFIPGKVLDEMEHVLHFVSHTNTPPRTHQMLQELRDLSSMAMEHFDEHILPRVKEAMDRKLALSAYSTSSSASRMLISHRVLISEFNKVKKHTKSQKASITNLSVTTRKLAFKVRKQNMRLRAQAQKLREQDRKIQEQASKIQEQAAKIQEQDTTIADVKKHMDEWDQKYIDLTTELIRARDDILAKTSQNQKVSPSASHASNKYYIPNIKPRVAQIKNYIALHTDLERKRKTLTEEIIPSKLFVYEDSNTDVSSTGCSNTNVHSSKEPFKEEGKHSAKSKVSSSGYTSIDLSSSLLDLGVLSSRSDVSSAIGASAQPSMAYCNIKSRKRKISDSIDLK